MFDRSDRPTGLTGGGTCKGLRGRRKENILHAWINLLRKVKIFAHRYSGGWCRLLHLLPGALQQGCVLDVIRPFSQADMQTPRSIQVLKSYAVRGNALRHLLACVFDERRHQRTTGGSVKIYLIWKLAPLDPCTSWGSVETCENFSHCLAASRGINSSC